MPWDGKTSKIRTTLAKCVDVQAFGQSVNTGPEPRSISLSKEHRMFFEVKITRQLF